jgi:hypothetical protein
MFQIRRRSIDDILTDNGLYYYKNLIRFQLKLFMKVITSNRTSVNFLIVEQLLSEIKCPLCTKGFKQPTNLLSCLNSHLKFNLYECLICTRTFPHYNSAKNHLKEHYGFNKRYYFTKEKPFFCIFCQEELNLSILTHFKRKHIDLLWLFALSTKEQIRKYINKEYKL